MSLRHGPRRRRLSRWSRRRHHRDLHRAWSLLLLTTSRVERQAPDGSDALGHWLFVTATARGARPGITWVLGGIVGLGKLAPSLA